MPLDFPSSPTNGQYYNGFVYNAANETWDSAYAPRAATVPIASPNFVINSAFDINQRGLTSSGITAGFGFDRWCGHQGSGTMNYSAQTFTPGTAPAANYEGANFARITTTSQTGTSNYAFLRNPIEDVRTLEGQTVTVSFWAKSGSGTPSVAIEFVQNFGQGGTPSTSVTGSVAAGSSKKISLTGGTSWTRYVATMTVPSISGKTIGTTANTSNLDLNFWVSGGTDFNTRHDSLGLQNNTFDFWGVQLEAGAAATDFRRNANSIQGELAACQRYYYRMTAIGNPGINFAYGIQYGSLIGVLDFKFPVTMRSAPASLDWTNSTSDYTLRSGAATYALTGNLTLANDSDGRPTPYLATVFAPCTSASNNTPLRLVSTTANAFIGFNAEL
jgi:hypothetical protein